MNNVFIRHKKGQAILELAIFGAILISLLGVMINYGLKYSYQQMQIQRAFRKAMGTAATSMSDHTPSSVSHTVIDDRHIPDPQHPFGIGTIMPFTGSGSVTRSAALHETPDFEDELPIARYTINGQTLDFKTAGFKEEQNKDNLVLRKYAQIYDAVQAWNTTENGWAYWESGTKTCIEWDPPTSTDDGDCTKWNYARVKYMDSCLGQLLVYEDVRQQCRRIIDPEVCAEDCVRAGGTECMDTCDVEIDVPWYCGSAAGAGHYEETNSATHVYNFPFLDTLFAFAKGENKDKAMGLQGDTALQRDHAEATLERSDNHRQAETRDTIHMVSDIDRKFVSKEFGTQGTATVTDIRRSRSVRDTDRRWRTPWD